MKKIFTLLALLTCFIGAKAANWQQVAEINFSQYTGYPHYVMGYVPEFFGDGSMTDLGGSFSYKTDEEMETYEFKEGESEVGTVATQQGVTYHKIEVPGGTWHQYFTVTGFPTEIDGHYKVVALVKASEACTVPMQMRWSWSENPVNAEASIGTDWAEVEWEYSGIGGSKCDLIAQPNTAATIQWQWIKVYEDKAETRPTTWQEWLTNDGKSIIPGEATNSKWMGDAETPWGNLAGVTFNDQTQNYLICAWGKEREVNMNADGGWDPFPATIEQESNGNHYYIVHGKAATTEGDAAAWDNQFWIQSPKEWTGGTCQISFRYKASKNVTVATQCHKQNPSDYLIWHAIGDIAFTTEWQTFTGKMNIDSDMVGTWSIAFQLNQNDKEAIDFYFDDLSWQSMVLDEGWFVAAQNKTAGLEYDFDNAIEFTDNGDGTLSATVGTKGDESSWVDEVMISTVRGDNASFKGSTINIDAPITLDVPFDEQWPNYAPATNKSIKLPASGVWKITLDTGFGAVNFELIEGKAKETVVINPNPTEITVNALERQPTAAEQPADEEAGIAEGTGQPWDNQFWIVAGRTLSAGEAVTVKFKYRADKPAKASTQCHGAPGSYLHWAAIGDVNFTEEWQDFSNTFTVASEADGMKSIAFNLAEIKDANNYYIKDVIWQLEDGTESLISQTGTTNDDGSDIFMSKIVGGAVEPAGIESVVDNKKVSNVTYNLAGQRVSKGYKGIVIKNGSKYIVK